MQLIGPNAKHLSGLLFLPLVLLALSQSSATERGDSWLLHLPLDNQRRQVDGTYRGEPVQGLHHPTGKADFDTMAATDPSTYRVKGKLGRGLRYFSDKESYTRVKGVSWDEPLKTLGLSLFVKNSPEGNRIGDLVTTRADTSDGGFALFWWGNELRFQYSDGQKRYDVRASASALTDGSWHQVEVKFDRGRVDIYIDGRRVKQASTTGQAIAPPAHPLTLGTYPFQSGGKRPYAFDGSLDEVVLGSNLKTVRHKLDQVVRKHGQNPRNAIPRAKPFETLAQPIEGNEPHFDGKQILHTFRGRPVPLTFLFKGMPDKLDSAKLVLYLPTSVRLRGTFQSNHNRAYETIGWNRSKVQRNGRQWQRLTTKGTDLIEGLQANAFGTGRHVTVGLDATNAGVQAAPVRWALKYNGKERQEESFTLRFLEPRAYPTAQEKGQFEVMLFFLGRDMVYPTRSLQEAIRKVYQASGIWGKGRFYNKLSKRGAFDRYLRKHGFTMYNIALWHGPLAGRYATDAVPPTRNREGDIVKGKPSPIAALNSETFRQAYHDKVANVFKHVGQSEYVISDYEPWGWPGKYGFDKPTVEAFKRQHGLDKELTPDEILANHTKEWALFWTDISTRGLGLFAEASRAADPNIEVIDYTYIFDYDDPKLWRRFYSIPKDLRAYDKHVDEMMLSLYHANGQAVVDGIERTRRAVDDARITAISSLSRANALQSRYTTPEESLSPQRLYQKTVLCAALGCQRMGLWPGNYIDGRHHVALGRACRLIWEVEHFFRDGKRADERVKVSVASGAAPEEFELLVHKHNGQQLVTLFNFQGRQDTFQVTGQLLEEAEQIEGIRNNQGAYRAGHPISIKMPAHGVRMLRIQ
jgi:hypothetical protein